MDRRAKKVTPEIRDTMRELAKQGIKVADIQRRFPHITYAGVAYHVRDLYLSEERKAFYIEKVKEGRMAGKTFDTISDELGISYLTLRSLIPPELLDDNTIPRYIPNERTGVKGIPYEAIQALLDQNLKPTEIGRRLGISRQGVNDRIRVRRESEKKFEKMRKGA